MDSMPVLMVDSKSGSVQIFGVTIVIGKAGSWEAMVLLLLLCKSIVSAREVSAAYLKLVSLSLL